MKAAVGWAMHNLVDAANIITARPRWQWYLPWNYPAYSYLCGVMRESWAFLRAVDMARNPERDARGNRYWFDERGRLVAWDRGDGNRAGRPPQTL